MFFDENDVLRAYLNNNNETQKTAKFETAGSLKSIITVDENGYYLGKYYQALLVLINTNGEVYLTDTTFGQLKKTTINDKIFNIEIDGKKLELKAEIQNRNGRTMYPFRECLEALGVTVSWNSIDRIAIGSVAGITVEFPIDKNIYYINGVEHKMDTYSYISTSGKTYIPLRYAAEAFKYQVKWVPGSIQNNVIIEKSK